VGKALGMELVTWSPNMTSERAAEGGAKAVTLEELLRTSKVVSLHLVPSEATRHLLNAEKLALMRPDSILANTARSALIDMKALEAALEKGRPGFAALDVYDDEPLAAGYPLAKRENVLLTPHLGFVNDSSFAKFGTGAVENLLNWLEGKPLVRIQTGP
jgi:phosphoglycerate dehydrogenase-like enzyme